jgi:hypothetical protein
MQRVRLNGASEKQCYLSIKPAQKWQPQNAQPPSIAGWTSAPTCALWWSRGPRTLHAKRHARFLFCHCRGRLCHWCQARVCRLTNTVYLPFCELSTVHVQKECCFPLLPVHRVLLCNTQLSAVLRVYYSACSKGVLFPCIACSSQITRASLGNSSLRPREIPSQDVISSQLGTTRGIHNNSIVICMATSLSIHFLKAARKSRIHHQLQPPGRL